MTLPQAYLTTRQLEIWKLRFRGLSQAEVGRRLGITRQGVYDAEKQMLYKVESALNHVAQVNRLDVDYLDSSKGILHGYHPSTKNRVIVTFSASNGVQTWHYEDPNCDVCQWEGNCKQRLLNEASERDVQLSEGEREQPASKLAHTIFSKVIPGLEK
jgi:DNA-binding CsgD family transcriptional regulator